MPISTRARRGRQGLSAMEEGLGYDATRSCARRDLIRQRLDGIATIMSMEQGKAVHRSQGRLPLPPHIDGWPRKGAAPTAVSCGARPRMSSRWYSRSRSAPSLPSRRGLPINPVVRKPRRRWHRLLDHRQGSGRHAGSCAELIKAFVDAGVPAGVIQTGLWRAVEISSI